MTFTTETIGSAVLITADRCSILSTYIVHDTHCGAAVTCPVQQCKCLLPSSSPTVFMQGTVTMWPSLTWSALSAVHVVTLYSEPFKCQTDSRTSSGQGEMAEMAEVLQNEVQFMMKTPCNLTASTACSCHQPSERELQVRFVVEV